MHHHKQERQVFVDVLRIGMDSLRPLGMTDYYLDLNGLASAVGALNK